MPVVEHPRPARRRFGAIGVLLATVLVLGACSSGGSDESSDTDSGVDSSGTDTQAGPFFGECGSVTDDEVVSLMGVTAFDLITRDSVGCSWEITGESMPSVAFSWYRGSPIARERAGSEMIGRPAEDIEVDGHPGFQGIGYSALTGQAVLCEIGIDFGADFQHWSINYGATPPAADPCEVARELAQLSIGRSE